MNTAVTVLGGTGQTGRILLSCLAENNSIDVTTLIRSPHTELPEGIHTIIGDATDSEVVAHAIDNADTVITLVAAAATEKHVGTVRSDATRVLVNLLSQHTKPCRLVAVSALGGSQSINQLTRPARWVYSRAVGKERFAEVDLQESLIANSRLPFTVVRPPRLDNKPGSGYEVTSGSVGISASLHRSDLAQCLSDLAILTNDQDSGFLTVSSL